MNNSEIRNERLRKTRLILRNPQFLALSKDEKKNALYELLEIGLSQEDLIFLLKEYFAERDDPTLISDVPLDVLAKMALNLPITKVNLLCRTNRNMSRLCEKDSFWKERIIKDLPIARNAKLYFPQMTWKSIYRLYYTLPGLRHPKQLTAELELFMSGKNLMYLPPEIGQLTFLHELHLDQNRLHRLPPELGQLSSLKQLFLQRNRLTSIPPELGQLSSLEILDLDFNELKSLPAELGQLSNLTKLLLSNNLLNSLPPELGQLSSLKKLDLRNNFYSVVESIPETLRDLNVNIVL